jgi:hypothetical protein
LLQSEEQQKRATRKETEIVEKNAERFLELIRAGPPEELCASIGLRYRNSD